MGKQISIKGFCKQQPQNTTEKPSNKKQQAPVSPKQWRPTLLTPESRSKKRLQRASSPDDPWRGDAVRLSPRNHEGTIKRLFQSSDTPSKKSISSPIRNPVSPSPLRSSALSPFKSSSLSSAPCSSSEAIPFSVSQRVQKNGKDVVTASDGDGSATESELEDPDNFFVRRGENKSTPPTDADAVSPSSESPSSVRRSARISKLYPISPAQDKGRKPRTGKNVRSTQPVQSKSIMKYFGERDSSPCPTAKRRKIYKFDLKSLVAQNEQDGLGKQDQTEALEAWKSYDDRQQSAQVPQDQDEQVALITSATQHQGDDNDVDRLLLALQRTETLQREKRWSMFRSQRSRKPAIRNAPRLDDPIWGPLIKDRFTREQTFLSGFAQQAASKVGAPESLRDWLIDALVFETREDLRAAYVNVLPKMPDSTTLSLTVDRISRLFQDLGASEPELDASACMEPITDPLEDIQPPSPHLLAVLSLIAQMSQYLGEETRQHCLQITCRLVIDESICKDATYQLTNDCALLNLLESLDSPQPNAVLGDDYLRSISDISLRAQLVRRFPTLTAKSISLRRELAKAFLFDALHVRPNPGLSIIEQTMSLLKQPKLAITRDTDFLELISYITMLNVALDYGDKPEADADLDMRKVHDENVDRLAAKVKEMHDSIVDAGASHMTKTQAKQELDILHVRILYSMRTKAKRREMMLGADGTDLGSTMRQGSLQFGHKITGFGKAKLQDVDR